MNILKVIPARAILLLGLVTLSTAAFGYQSVIDTGEIIPEGTFKMGGEVQFAGGDFSGTNELIRLDAGVNDSSNVRAILGTGSMSFNGALYYKYVPVPDIGNQPALGLTTGFEYGYYNPYNEFSLETKPMISKKLHTVEAGALTPYLAVPVGVTFGTDRTRLFTQLAVGTYWQPETTGQFSFYGELGFNIANAFDYVSFAFAYNFDRGAAAPRPDLKPRRSAPLNSKPAVQSHEI
jgi:hypothetical protein